jgi:hypothetical protein
MPAFHQGATLGPPPRLLNERPFMPIAGRKQTGCSLPVLHAEGLMLPKTAGWLKKKLRGGRSYDRTTSGTALLLLILARPTSSAIGKDRVAESDAAIFARTIEIIVVPCEEL